MSSIAEIMAKQARRIAIRAAEAAKVKPQPDYVYREPMPTPPKATRQGVIAAFVEDRMYDSKPADGYPGLNPDSVKSMWDVHNILAVEQPQEYMIGKKSDFATAAPQFGRETGEGYPAEITGRESDTENGNGMKHIAQSPTDEMFKAWAEAEAAQKAALTKRKKEAAMAVKASSLDVQVKTDATSPATPGEPENEMGISEAQQQMLNAMRLMRQRNY